LVKTAILVSFFGLSRPKELIQIRSDEEFTIRENDGGYVTFKPKAECNRVYPIYSG
jgi:hypothetical protein